MSERRSAPPASPETTLGLSVLRTRDGSCTVYDHKLDERYHSVHGAVQESFHVFIRMGLEATAAIPLRVLEVGLGTGLNMLLTWVEADLTGRNVAYTALEPFPLSLALLVEMDHTAALELPERSGPFLELMTLKEGAIAQASATFNFQVLATPVQEFDRSAAYDLIYFDAFGPATQPGMWTLDVFQRMFNALAPGGILVTYCAKGAVRRTMQAAGFITERVPGPVGKKEMLRARKPD
ncbi:MAG: tRNA (5-methylaminomethyl-2-thiouridine)(34)-methyltransferase MnmD [Flavobacteriales bacterium]|nr:tRNA (5-methylaminomethyl-2-thiouridine)(34)-methyltransferase MnmD [Flavobacteriales bacterium]